MSGLFLREYIRHIKYILIVSQNQIMHANVHGMH